ncbi:CSS-motif domain-containing protein [Enterobacter cloacae]|nr:CSS-motif domain-containing protein [Enterobacter cloacae]
MHLDEFMNRSHNQSTATAAAVFMIFFMAGMTVLGLQAYRNIMNITTARLTEVRVGVEIILEHARSASLESAQFRGKACTPDVLEHLRKIVANTPDVRTLNLFLNRRIYCTTVFGDKEIPYPSLNQTNERLFLMPGNDLTPYRSLVVFRDPVDASTGSLIGIDGYYFTNLLQRAENEPAVSIIIGNQQIDRMGCITRADITGHSLVISSALFPFNVTASVNGKMVLTSLAEKDAGSVLIVIIFSLGLTLLLNNYIRTRQSLESQLRRALKLNQFVPYIQPIVSVTSKEITGGKF